MNRIEHRHFLIVDDDPTFSRILARAMRLRGYEVQLAESVEQALQCLQAQLPDQVTVDLKMEGASGLTLIPHLRAASPAMRILVLTGYSSISTAVEAIKLGASNYLPKPANADQILAALAQRDADPGMEIDTQPMSVSRLEWEHIQKVLGEHQGNVSATARALGMHRRTLQRKLLKRPVKR
ncbi:response regulator transcription factor [Marinobacterium sedimentorum]|uniref:response regulator transcription factor n=1 Tax=Marinobacterium sedimentorum TaxID=2927804 RepID=UPI0020C617C0|nr:response regulator transcription factor [Marinobacterium sedimentorum]MCP8685975.1 response regulator transcription factor [Marinobacterium sedimentorum]